MLIPRQFRWIKALRNGDVVKTPNGTLRVCRDVRHSGPSLGKTNVTFTILHCSWTGRCYTSMTGNDLKQFGYKPTKARVRLNRKFDKALDYEIRGRVEICLGKPMYCPPLPQYVKLHCCDVKGIH